VDDTKRIDGAIVVIQTEMQVRPGAEPRAAHVSYDLSLFDIFSSMHPVAKVRHVGVERFVAVTVVDDDDIAVSSFATAKDDAATPGSVDGRAASGTEIHTQVRTVAMEYGVPSFERKTGGDARTRNSTDEHEFFQLSSLFVVVAIVKGENIALRVPYLYSSRLDIGHVEKIPQPYLLGVYQRDTVASVHACKINAMFESPHESVRQARVVRSFLYGEIGASLESETESVFEDSIIDGYEIEQETAMFFVDMYLQFTVYRHQNLGDGTLFIAIFDIFHARTNFAGELFLFGIEAIVELRIDTVMRQKRKECLALRPVRIGDGIGKKMQS